MRPGAQAMTNVPVVRALMVGTGSTHSWLTQAVRRGMTSAARLWREPRLDLMSADWLHRLEWRLARRHEP
jgi:hypothetical protein